MITSEIFRGDESEILVIIGDGKYEERILRYISLKFNGRGMVLVIPRLPIPKKTGLAALEGLVTILHTGYHLKAALFIVDREHISDIGEIDDKLHSMGCDIKSHEILLKDKALIYDLLHGSHEVRLYVVIAGEVKCINEEVAKLAYRIYGKMFSEEDIKRVKLKELMRKADTDHIKESLKGLSTILQKIEQLK